MPSSFDQTMRVLDRDRAGSAWLWPALFLALSWLSWSFVARVDVSASARRARLEVDHMVSRVAAQADGRIAVLRCELGRRVEQGEILAELDSTLERAQLAELEVELSTLDARTRALEAQLEAEKTRRRSRERVDEVTGEQAAVELERTRVVADHKQELAAIAVSLDQQQVVSRNEALNAAVESSGSRLHMHSAALEIARVRATGAYEERVSLARSAELLRMLTDVESESAVKNAAVATLVARLEMRKLVAPIAGRLGNIAPLQVGDVVKAGDLLATVIPSDEVRVVAEFDPEDAVGRVLPNQAAKLRLHGFSWLEFGLIDVTVRKVANEPHDGSIRVELSIDGRLLPEIPLQHGLPGSVDVLVDRVAPWSLLLRSVGAALVRERSP